jgi:hypothetical protein
MKCYFKWARGDFADAVKWGKIAQNIKASTDVDTRHDVIHNLALAERDAGMPELALPVFLAGRNISAVIDPEELDEKDENAGHRYGIRPVPAFYGPNRPGTHLLSEVRSFDRKNTTPRLLS